MLDQKSQNSSSNPRVRDSSKRDRICQFYLKGHCKKGEQCPYKHERPSSAPRKDTTPPCREFLKKGPCTYGDNCKFSHEAAAAPRTKAKARAKAKGKVAVCMDGREVATTRESEPRDKSRLQLRPQDTLRPGEKLEKDALSGQPATRPEPSPHSILTPQVTARSRALQVTARLRTQPKPNRCCRSVHPSVIKEPEYLFEEHKTLGKFQKE